MAEKTESQKIAEQWREFSKTKAYKDLIEYIDLQKEILYALSSGPMEVMTFDDKGEGKLEFEPEKYAYLLQRAHGCDIVKTYVEGFTTP